MSEVIKSRSHRRMLKQLSRAAERHERLLQRGDDALSLESGLGKLAIIVSGRMNFRSVYSDPSQLGKEIEGFREEAERLAEERAPHHQAVVIRPKAVPREMAFDFADPEITDIILIGHGNISNIWADPRGYFTWRDVAKNAARLKQGKVEQRMCGDFSKGPVPYYVPLGTFAVNDPRNVLAAAGMVIPDSNPADRLFRPIYNGEGDILGQIAALNQRYIGNTVVVEDVQATPPTIV